jgi:hypothetical protein
MSAPNPSLFRLAGDPTAGTEITLRDLFAMAAMHALIAMASSERNLRAFYEVASQNGGAGKLIASGAYEYADAMLAEREKRAQP